jgi:hypothetical protein
MIHWPPSASGSFVLNLSPPYNPVATFYVYEEFLVGALGATCCGSLPMIPFGVGGSFLVVASEPGHIGILQRSTGAAIGNDSGLSPQLTSQPRIGMLPAERFSLRWVVRLNTNDANTTVRIGLNGDAVATTTNPPTDGIYFEKLDGDTNWFRVTRAAGVQTRTDTGIAITANFAVFRVRRLDASTVGFTIDTASEQTDTTNIPTVVVNPWTYVITSAAAVKSLDYDFFDLYVAK